MKRTIAALTAAGALSLALPAQAAAKDFYIGPVGCVPGTSGNINLTLTAWDYGKDTRVHYDVDGGINKEWPLTNHKFQPAYVDTYTNGVRTRRAAWNDAYATLPGQYNFSLTAYWYYYKWNGSQWVYVGRTSCVEQVWNY